MTRRDLLFSAVALKRLPLQWLDLNLEARTTQCHWSTALEPVSLGSLLKPFLSLAYGATHMSYPKTFCAGLSSGCWYSRGHGQQGFVEALANSCNAYFLALAAETERAALDTVCLSYGLASPSRALTPANLIGLGEGWPQAPQSVAQAFATLAANANEPEVQLTLAGMARCAKMGTARAVGMSCFAKTGTAPCGHFPPASGDGFAVAMFPLDRPRRLLFVQHHNTTGAMAARDIKPLLIST